MRIWRNLRQALYGVRRNKGNTFLMALGIVIGIASLTVIVAIGEGAKKQVLAQIADMGFGPDSFSVRTGSGKLFFNRGPEPNNLTLSDADDIRAMSTVTQVVPIQRKSMRAVYRGKNTFTRVFGVPPNWKQDESWKIADGRFLSEEDMDRKAKVVVLGATPAKKLFNSEDPIEKMVRIGSVYFKVIGTFAPKGMTESGYDPDDRVLIPLSTSIARLFRQTYLQSIQVRTVGPERVAETMESVRNLLRQNHKLSVIAEDDFRFITPEGIMEWRTQQEQALNRMLTLISTVSLFVGGIVIMNIMLVSVRERIHEIGVRRCFGARRSDIIQQFLFEAVFVSLVGGGGGVLLGIAVSLGLQRFQMATHLTWQPFILAFVFSALIGLVFGVQPARKAALLTPEEALR